jgi:polyhydroxyalkanoate synthesis regulator phasin
LDQLVRDGQLLPEEAERLCSLLMKSSSQSTQSEMPQAARRETLENLLADLERLSTILDELSTPPTD